jgi:membrane protein
MSKAPTAAVEAQRPHGTTLRRRHTLSEWWGLVKAAIAAWSDDYAPSMGAALSYYSVFSMAPLLLIVVSVAGLVFGEEAARGQLFGQLRGLMGTEAAAAIESLLAHLSLPERGLSATVVSAVVLLIGATTVFGELQDALDRIWRAPARVRATGLWRVLRSRLLSFGMILGIAFLLMVSLVLSAAISALGKWWGGFFDTWEWLLQAVNMAIGFALTTTVFAMIYKLIPRVHVRWHDVWLGALTTAALFTVGRFLIGLYIGKSGVASGFGAAGSIAIVFVWVYYSSQIFLLGAEFTWVYAKRFGSLRGSEAAPPSAPGPAPESPTGARTTPSTITLPLRHAPIAPPQPNDPSVRRAAMVPRLIALALTMTAALGVRWIVSRLVHRSG